MNYYPLDLGLVDAQMRRTAQMPGDNIKKIVQKAILSSCTIIVFVDNRKWTGSGYHIGNGYIITASHVAPPDLSSKPHELSVTFDGEHLMKATIVNSVQDVDGALLHCQTIPKDIPSVSFANSDTVEIGDIIAVVGSPEGWHDTVTFGRVSNVEQDLGNYAPNKAWHNVIFIDADILEGSSGSMVVNEAGLIIGNVIGVTGKHADLGIGQRAIEPSNRLRILTGS
jgi:S1-C subfamily serine protease